MKYAAALSVRRLVLCLTLVACALLLAVSPDAPPSAGAAEREALTLDAATRTAAVAAVRAAAQSGPNTIGQWGPQEFLDTVPVHISVLPDGRLLYWGRDKHADKWDIGDTCQTYTWHPTTKVKQTLASKPPTNLFCSAHSFLPDGRLLVTGGHERDNDNPSHEAIGAKDVNVFDYRTNKWTFHGEMPLGRWYPSQVTLASGESVTVSGWHRISVNNYVMNDWPDRLTFDPSVRPYSANAANPLYPYLHLAPNGKVFIAGSGPDASKYFDPAGAGAFTLNVADYTLDHVTGSSVTYDSVAGKILMVGGAHALPDSILREAQTIDLTNDPVWRGTNAMRFRRKFHTATILPNGKVLVTGGTQCTGTNKINCSPDTGGTTGKVTKPELWDPQFGTWTEMAENPSLTPRVYHSVAVLLPDARVLVGGGGLPAAGGESVPTNVMGVNVNCVDGNHARTNEFCRTYGHNDVEIFSPPYLFTSSGAPAARPPITSAPTSVNLGQTFNVGKTSAFGIQSVVLVRLPSVTHGFNFDQRRVVLNFTTTSSTNLSVTMPSDGRIVPPGPYMLFIINFQGVPSIARILQVNAPANAEVGGRVVRHHDGRIQVFYRGAANDILTTAQTSTGSTTWSAHTSLGGTLTSNPVAVKRDDGRLHVFARGLNNVLYHQWQTTPGGSGWSGWTVLGSGVQATSEIAVARNGNGILQVFFRGNGNSLQYVAQTSATDPNAWGALVNLGGGLNNAPSVEANSDGRLEVFVTGLDNAIYHIWQTAPGGGWSPFHGLGGFTLTTQLAVARNTDGTLQVFYRASDNSLYFIRQSHSAPSGWGPHTPLGGGLNGDPAVGTNSDGRLEVFVRGTDNGLHHQWQTTPGGNFSGWQARGVVVTSNVAPARNADGRLSVVFRSSGNALSYSTQSSPGSAVWSGFTNLGGNASSF